MNFFIDGKITFDIQMDIEAESEEEALKEAKKQLSEYYHLNVRGAYHSPNDVRYNIYAAEAE